MVIKMLYTCCILKSGCYVVVFLQGLWSFYPRLLKELLVMVLPGLCLVSLKIQGICVSVFSGGMNRPLTVQKCLDKGCFSWARLPGLCLPTLSAVHPDTSSLHSVLNTHISLVTSSSSPCLALQVRISSDICKSSISLWWSSPQPDLMEAFL